MKITVRSFSGSEVAVLQVDRSQRVQELKRAIHAAAGVPVWKQKLLANTELLRDVDLLDAALPEGDAADLTLVLQENKWANEVAAGNWRCLRGAPEIIRNDPEVVLEAIAHSQGQALRFAREEARANADVLLAAMRHDVSLSSFARRDLTADTTFMIAAAELMLEASRAQRERSPILKWPWHQSAELCASRVFISCVLSATHGDALKHASPELRGDREIARLAVDSAASAFCHVSEQLRADRDFVMQALQRREQLPVTFALLQHTSPALRADREIVSAAVRRFPPDLEYASDELKGDRAVVELALQGGPGNRHPGVVRHAAEALQRDRSFALPLVRQNPSIFANLCPAAWADREVALEAVRREGGMLGHASEELRADPEVVLAAVHQDAEACRFANEPRGDEAVLAAAGRPRGRPPPEAVEGEAGQSGALLEALRQAP
mmetsp:Transcript_60640/g.121426  ORF Transcript_60640/g.121426 Transcript_60640/m.121426 type:complete len:438 (+) Transcript_60640:104-1417(+)